MSEYIYRVDTILNLNKVCNDTFRAKRWTKNSYPHKLLKNAQTLPTDGLYLICFFTTQQLAETALKNDFSHLGDSRISRCHKETILRVGFSESWDDGFIPGEAYLFWCTELLNEQNHEFSETNIPISHFETLNEEEWVPLANSDSDNTLTPSYFSSLPIPKKKPWWKFWL
ncbi:hypothetical protein NL87_25900 [Salmonella enterica]|uniref:hypothetical protein n=1 Tax=Salmonella enterica TaxID=28901 RepID=UPI0009EA5DA7|nr:hypothetical protein [Salmonella enterica]EAW9009524.1 hypothetical protein [Salmonella enterica]EAY5640304.1 hypothetical protein [Salmonella enterica]EBP3785604.1 hypothetical protein [Salmonella enterica subsp. enterica]EBP3795450.1 hypothetical protein [Salmonella enterica subsp. enterica]